MTNTAPGQNPTVIFQLTENDGTPIPPSAFTSVNSDGTTSSGLNVIMGGPTTDYAINPQSASAPTARRRAEPTTATRSRHAIPADATGTWAFSIEARLTVTLNPAPSGHHDREGSAFNPVFYAAVTDAEAVPRRVVVDIANCNKCHDKLALHGGQRLNPQECVICHNPNERCTRGRRSPPESIDFKRLIHRIHTGREPDAGPTASDDVNFNEVRFPGDRRDCADVPRRRTRQQVLENPPPGLLPTETPRDWYTPHAAQRRRVPGLPRLAGRRGARVHHDGALRRGLRDLPRPGRGVRGRQGSRAVGAVGETAPGRAREGVRAS